MCETHCSQYICEYHCRLWTSFIWKYTGMRKCIVYRSLECIGYALSKKNRFFFQGICSLLPKCLHRRHGSFMTVSIN